MINVTTAIAALWAQITRASAPTTTPRTRPPQTKRRTRGKPNRAALAPQTCAPALPYNPAVLALNLEIHIAVNKLEALLKRHPDAVILASLITGIRRTLLSVK